MKTKLLKIVRKRFEILKINKVNDTSLWHYSPSTIYPYYLIIDNEIDYASSKHITYDVAREQLIVIIRNKYIKYSRKPRMIYKKVWYNEK
ncbi:hypothetical protein M0Q97_13550 [Candidatus Dojkabacteria bacterium]|jgi:hypothetical protein|nr:hypothetical protein [Candidatus Dojkabacteria bacterium]